VVDGMGLLAELLLLRLELVDVFEATMPEISRQAVTTTQNMR